MQEALDLIKFYTECKEGGYVLTSSYVIREVLISLHVQYLLNYSIVFIV